jgi:hypothetical protein
MIITTISSPVVIHPRQEANMMKRVVRATLLVGGLAAAFLGGSVTMQSVSAQQWGQGGWQGQRHPSTPKQITQMSIVGLRRIATRLKDCGTECGGEAAAFQAVNDAIVALGGHAVPQ